jgi:diguanylate cyclase (GGDEF)-like protein
MMILESNEGLRESIASVLRARYGTHAVMTAGRLSDAASVDLREVDLVLTEWRLADAVGPKVLDALRLAGAGSIIVITEAHPGATAAAADAINCGAADFVVRHTDFLFTLPLIIEKNLAVARLRKERDALHRQLREQNETLEQLLRSLEEAASTDPLTNLNNRRQFSHELERLFAGAERSHEELACVMLDMDGFKQLNDTFGHQAGDAALVTTANVIRENLRKMDVAARYGGDEFVLLLPRTDPVHAAGVARRIRDAYAAEMQARGFKTLPLGMSFGVASMQSDHPASADQLVASADAALYRAKRLGRDRVYISASSPQGSSPARAAG